MLLAGNPEVESHLTPEADLFPGLRPREPPSDLGSDPVIKIWKAAWNPTSLGSELQHAQSQRKSVSPEMTVTSVSLAGHRQRLLLSGGLSSPFALWLVSVLLSGPSHAQRAFLFLAEGSSPTRMPRAPCT